MTSGRLLIGGNYAHSGSSSTYVTLGRLPDWPAPAVERVLTCRLPVRPSVLTNPVCGAVERHGRRSGGLAATFIPASGSELVISAPVSHPLIGSARNPGLNAEFASAIIQGFEKLGPSPLLGRLGAGRLDINLAWWHEIDSSVHGFLDLPASLVGVLSLPASASPEEVWACWRDQNEALRLAPLLAWLRSALPHKPELAGFRPGAAPMEIAALEASLGFALPELVRRLLLCVNGGSFICQPPKPESDNPLSCCELLGIEQIGPAWFTLAAAQRELGGDHTIAPWPFLPLAKELNSDALIVLEVLPAPYANRIQRAIPGLSWREWPILHRRFTEFVEKFFGLG